MSVEGKKPGLPVWVVILVILALAGGIGYYAYSYWIMPPPPVVRGPGAPPGG